MGASLFAQALKKNATIEEFSIKGNEIGNEGLKVLCEALLVCCVHFHDTNSPWPVQEREAEIRSLDIGNNLITEEGIEMLARLIRAKKIENLEVYNNDLADGGLYKVHVNNNVALPYVF